MALRLGSSTGTGLVGGEEDGFISVPAKTGHAMKYWAQCYRCGSLHVLVQLISIYVSVWFFLCRIKSLRVCLWGATRLNSSTYQLTEIVLFQLGRHLTGAGSYYPTPGHYPGVR